MNFFGNNLKYSRTIRGLSQKALVEILEEKYEIVLTNNQISNYEKGVSYAPMLVAIAISEIFNETLDDLCKIDLRTKPPNGKGNISTTDDEMPEYGASRQTTESPPKTEKQLKLEVMQMMMKQLEEM
jgi:transcriptional regulator with XRE-family HTH domain